MRGSQFQSSFSAGQLTDRLDTRIDTQIYRSGALEITNAVPMLQGGWVRRPGFRHRATLPGRSRAIGHVYNRSVAEILVFSAGSLHVYDPNGLLLWSLANMPWTAETLWFMSIDIQGAFTVITDQSFHPIVLTRQPGGYTAEPLPWSKTRDNVPAVPMSKLVLDAVTLQPSGAEGQITLTSNGPMFSAGHVGTVFRVRDGYVRIDSLQSSTVVNGTVLKSLRKLLDPAPFATVKGSNIVTVTMANHGAFAGYNVTFSNCADVGVDENEENGMLMDGTFTILDVPDANHFTVNYAQKVSTYTGAKSTEDGGGGSVRVELLSATRDWEEPVYSPVRGWPQACAFYGARLWLGGGSIIPDSLFGSSQFAFFNFDAGGGGPADAVKAIGQTQSNELRHLIAANDLLAFGDAGEASFPPSQEQGIIQATVRGVPAPTRIGSAWAAPVLHDGVPIFCDVMGQHVYEFVYASEMRGYVPTPLSSLCPEVVRRPLSSHAYRGAPGLATAFTLWPSSDDGTAGLFYSRRAERAAGWALWQTDGRYLSFCSLNERLYAVVERPTGDGVAVYLEEADWSWVCRGDDGRDLLPLNAGGTLWEVPDLGAGVTLHLYDPVNDLFLEEVVTGDGGQFNTIGAYTGVLAMRPFSFRLESMPLIQTDGMTNAIGAISQVTRLIVHLHETRYAVVQDQTVAPRDPVDPERPGLLLSGPVEMAGLGHSRRPTVRIESDRCERVGVKGFWAKVA